ncbi:hypothetical protein HZH68_006260 [Vespula germanica]|uniref:Uncharacterized protein n=1 Tax=Vespula germanica TaxID=30212 RepID=A0A834KD06_VESGE|nr:hypothetical protein HZH68_006260 [Vespula germanica]
MIMKRVLTCENHEVPLVLREKSMEFFCNIPNVTRLEDKMKGDSLRESTTAEAGQRQRSEFFRDAKEMKISAGVG